jgi:undecaprenyl phosphate-alpha-L-ara4FN deformylase
VGIESRKEVAYMSTEPYFYAWMSIEDAGKYYADFFEDFSMDRYLSLLRTMDRHGVRAAYFFSVGPDNMGRNLWRLLKPTFLFKMLRTNAPGLYGMDILLMGTAWPGPAIGRRNEQVLRDCAAAGHEIGLHAWDHCKWQNRIASFSPELILKHLRLAYGEIERITGRPPVCSASPGWKTTDAVLTAK